MTLSEFRDMLNVFGVDPNTDFGKDVIDRILTMYGNKVMASKAKRCSTCWMKRHGRCSEICDVYDLPNDPKMVAKSILVNPNDINVMSFAFEYVIPIYEKDTGATGTIDKLRIAFAKRMKKEFGNTGTEV